MMIRNVILLLLVAGTVAVRASDPIAAPAEGASALVSQPHVTAELIPEVTTVQPGQPFDVALHLHTDPGWHTYWINPGDAGFATTITWTLPPGFTASPIQWPTPEKHAMGPEITYGYAGDVYLLTTITPPKSDLPRQFDVKAHAEWLVCQEECIPGKADLTLPLDSGLLNLRLPQENTDLFARARERLPVPNIWWDVSASYAENGSDSHQLPYMSIQLTAKPGAPPSRDNVNVSFFPELPNVLATQNHALEKEAQFGPHGGLAFFLDLQQNGEKPDKLSGVLVSDQPLIGNAKSVYISEFPVGQVAAAVPSAGAAAPSGGPATTGVPALSGTPQATGGSPQASATPVADDGDRPPLQLIGVLVFAFIGGLILNLMPCVLPVLSLKVFH